MNIGLAERALQCVS